MTEFAKTLTALSGQAGLTIEDALNRAVPYLDAAHLANRIRNEDYVPDMTTLTKLADYFGIGLDTFIPEYTCDSRESRVYLAGPITGVPDFMERFGGAKAYLESKGKHVFSPAHVTERLPKAYMTRKDFMDLGIFLLSMCEEIAVMPGYESHSGCQLEIAYAEANRYPFIWLSEGHIKQGIRMLPEQKGGV